MDHCFPKSMSLHIFFFKRFRRFFILKLKNLLVRNRESNPKKNFFFRLTAVEMLLMTPRSAFN
jgi:hypothetical protein